MCLVAKTFNFVLINLLLNFKKCITYNTFNFMFSRSFLTYNESLNCHFVYNRHLNFKICGRWSLTQNIESLRMY